jgi:hypothetical protein
MLHSSVHRVVSCFAIHTMHIFSAVSSCPFWGTVQMRQVFKIGFCIADINVEAFPMSPCPGDPRGKYIWLDVDPVRYIVQLK